MVGIEGRGGGHRKPIMPAETPFHLPLPLIATQVALEPHSIPMVPLPAQGKKGHLHGNVETSILASCERSHPLGHPVPSVVRAHISTSLPSCSLSLEARVWKNVEAVF